MQVLTQLDDDDPTIWQLQLARRALRYGRVEAPSLDRRLDLRRRLFCQSKPRWSIGTLRRRT
jgi:hypothetical protein